MLTLFFIDKVANYRDYEARTETRSRVHSPASLRRNTAACCQLTRITRPCLKGVDDLADAVAERAHEGYFLN